jgi:probable sporulation protein (polysaccharide deacetylase family)
MRIHFFFTPVRPWMSGVLILALLALLAGFGVASTLGVKQLVQVFATGEDPIFRGAADRPQIGITCNVAWGAEYLPAMLDTLKEQEARATFFMEGRWVEQFPELTRRIFQEGHELGNHSYSHPYPTKISREELRTEILETEALLENLTGVKPTLFAPPYGDWNQEVVKTAADLGYKTIMWSIDTIDWEGPGVEVIVDRVLENHHNGAIVLLHPTEQTVDALPQILTGLKEKGYCLVTVSELLRE